MAAYSEIFTKSYLKKLKTGDIISDGKGFTDVVKTIDMLESKIGKLYTITTQGGMLFSIMDNPREGFLRKSYNHEYYPK